MVEGHDDNRKITTADDLRQAATMETRTAFGFDVHGFGPGNAVMLGGVAIPHAQALAGHSDADVALHALTDAVLGTIGAGDIGKHFPPSDPQWRGASSDRFLRHAVELLAARRRAHRASRSHADLRSAAHRPASRGDGRQASRASPASSVTE